LPIIPYLIANMDANRKGEFIRLSVKPDGKSYGVGFGPAGTLRNFNVRSASR
jgi:hypothetical protein